MNICEKIHRVITAPPCISFGIYQDQIEYTLSKMCFKDMDRKMSLANGEQFVLSMHVASGIPFN